MQHSATHRSSRAWLCCVRFQMESFYDWSRNFPFFSGMSKSVHMEMISRARLVQIPRRGTLVYREGDEPNGLFVVLQGSLGIFAEPDLRPGSYLNYAKAEPEGTVQRGECVGEKELASEDATAAAAAAAASAQTGAAAGASASGTGAGGLGGLGVAKAALREWSVATLCDSVSLLHISRSDYAHLRSLNKENLAADVVAFLRSCAVFAHWDPAALTEIAPLFQRRTFQGRDRWGTSSAGGASGAGGGGATGSSSRDVGAHSSAGVIVGENLEDIDSQILLVTEGSALIIRRSEQQKFVSQRGLTAKQKMAKFKRKQMKKLVADSKEREAAAAAHAARTMTPTPGGSFRKHGADSSGEGGMGSGGGAPGHHRKMSTMHSMDLSALSGTPSITPTHAGPHHSRRPSFMFGGSAGAGHGHGMGGHSRGASLMGGANASLAPSTPTSALGSAHSTSSLHGVSVGGGSVGGSSSGGAVCNTGATGRGHVRRVSISLFQQNESRKRTLLEQMEARKLAQKDEVDSSSEDDEEDDDEEEAEEERLVAQAASAAAAAAADAEADALLSDDEREAKRNAAAAAAAAAPSTDFPARETFVDAWVVARLKAGDMFGVSPLERPQTYYTRNVFLRTSDHMRALLITRKDFEQFVLHSVRHAHLSRRSRLVLAMMSHLRNGLLKAPLKRSPEEVHTLLAYFHTQHSLGPHPFLAALTPFGRSFFVNACKVEVVRKQRIVLMPNEMAEHLYGASLFC